MSIVENALGKLKGTSLAIPGSPPPVPRVRADVAASFVAAIEQRPQVELNSVRLRQHGVLPPVGDDRQLMAQYREIKRGVLAGLSMRAPNSASDGQLIMVASAHAGEGKTFTSYNLARSLATERDWATILVDADVARRRLTTAFGLEDQPGLVDVLADPSRPLLDVMYRTSAPGLLFVPSGSQVENGTELLASAKMRDMLRVLQRHNPNLLVLFDSSPVVPTPESRALADNVGQVVFVVRAGHTPQTDVESALALLGTDRHVGVVLNMFQGEMPTHEYYAPGSGTDPAK